MTPGLRRGWELLANEWSAEEEQGVVPGVERRMERQAERDIRGALCYCQSMSFIGVLRGV
jgi:hypothetical protein